MNSRKRVGCLCDILAVDNIVGRCEPSLFL